MKKLFLFLMCVASLPLAAQRNIYVWVNGVANGYAISVVDSVTFADELQETKILAGVFSISATQQVSFSRGNLQYTQSTGMWSFAENQYDFIGTDNVTGGTVSPSTYGDEKSGDALADKIDLFGWSGSTGSAKWGIGTSTSYSDYSGDFADWGQNIGDGATWRTLTCDEWEYLLNTRDNADNLKGVAMIDLGDEKYANGLVLLPDDWQQPEDVTFKSGFSSSFLMAAYGEYQTFSLTEWQSLENAGAVFLPASGYRNGTDIGSIGYIGYYWYATPYNEEYAMELGFFSLWAGKDERVWRYCGQSVRLVRDVER